MVAKVACLKLLLDQALRSNLDVRRFEEVICDKKIRVREIDMKL